MIGSNRKRRDANYDRAYGFKGRRGDAVRRSGCILEGHALHRCLGPTQACHAIARGRGGTKGDYRVLFGACASAHCEFGEYRTSQRAEAIAKYEIDPVEAAAVMCAELDERLGPERCHLCGKFEHDKHSLCRANGRFGRVG